MQSIKFLRHFVLIITMATLAIISFSSSVNAEHHEKYRLNLPKMER